MTVSKGPSLIVLLAFAAATLAGCEAKTFLTPDVAGVVVGIGGTNNATRFELADGQALTIDITNASVVAYGGGPPAEGDLLLGGTGLDGPWVARLPLSSTSGAPPDCYELGGFGTDRGEWIETDVGLRLPKAPRFDPGPVHDVHDGTRYEWTPGVFCVNPDGQVTRFGL